MEPILLRLDTRINNYASIDLMQGYNYTLEAHITDNYKDVDLTSVTVQLQMQKPDKKFIIQTENIIIEGNKIKATLDKDFTRKDGQAKLQVVLLKDNFTFGSWVIKAKIKPSAINDNDGQSENKVTITEALVNKISEAENTKIELDKSIANGDVATIKGNVDNIKDVEIPKINEQLETIANNIQIFVEDFKKQNGDVSDSERIQRAINKAKMYFNSTNEGSESGLYYYNNVDVVFDSKIVYTCHSSINIPYGVSITAYGKCKIKAPNFEKIVTLFTINNKRFDTSNFQFIGFKKVYEFSGGNIDCSIINIINNNFHHCEQAIDTFSYDVSESTMLTIDRCSFNEVDIFLNNYCDKTVIQNSWLYHSGYNGSAIINYNKLEIKNCLGVPKRKSGNSPSWITQKTGKYIACINCDGTRFGAEQGGIPVIINEVPYSKSTLNCMTCDLIFENCQLSSASSASFILEQLPNNITIRNCYGMYDQTKGFIITSGSINPDDENENFINFEIDNKIIKASIYPYVQKNLERFLISNKSFNQNHNEPLEKKHINELSIVTGSLEKNSVVNLYKLGANGNYSTGVIELEIYISNGARNKKNSVILSFSKGTSNNTITGFTKLTETKVFSSHSDMDFDTNIECEIVDGKLNINMRSNVNNSCMYCVKGVGVVSALYWQGDGIVEN